MNQTSVNLQNISIYALKIMTEGSLFTALLYHASTNAANTILLVIYQIIRALGIERDSIWVPSMG